MAQGSWTLAFSQGDGVRGSVRLAIGPARAQYWAVLLLPDGRAVVVRDDDVQLPRGRLLEVRADGLWAEVVCEVPDEHWAFALEAFGLVVDDVDEARTAERGERVPVGLDLEWDAGRVVGEVLVGRERLPVDGEGTLVDAPYAPDAPQGMEARFEDFFPA